MAIRRQHIVNIVVEALKGEAGSPLVSLRRVVEHHIQNTFNAVLVKSADQLFQLGSFLIIFYLCGITGIGCKETDRIIPPIIHYRLSIHNTIIPHFIKLKDGHQLHGIDPKLL